MCATVSAFVRTYVCMIGYVSKYCMQSGMFVEGLGGVIRGYDPVYDSQV